LATITQVQPEIRQDSTAWNPIIVLIVALAAASFAAIFMKLAMQAGLPAPVVATGRLLLAAVVMTPYVLSKHADELRHLSRRDILFAVIAGVLFIAHFLSITYALGNTSIMLLTVVLNTGPLWTALLEKTFLKERLNRIIWMGLLITIAGGVTIAVLNNTSEATASTSHWGIWLALFGSISGSAILTIGRSVRAKVSMPTYSWLVFGTGGLVGLLFIFATQTPVLGHPLEGYIWLILLTLISQIVGHGGFNYVAAYFNATFISITGQSLTITAALAAFVMLHEVPGVTEIIGSSIILSGVLLAIYGRNQLKNHPPKV
jgi:drug/metabolite transporter (DMT)-like permease